MERKRKKKNPLGQTVFVLFSLLMGVGGGVVILEYLIAHDGLETGFSDRLPSVLLFILCLYAAIFLQLILHEAGHLVFGLLSGYRFQSFRIGSFLWLREEGRLRLRRMSLAGTGGQCLMEPPELRDGKMPYALYNLGGSLMNLLTALLFFAIALCLGPGSLPGMLLKLLAVAGLGTALQNGIPLRMGMINNDGYNTLEMRRDESAIRALWVQLMANSAQARGQQLKDMPENWFWQPEEKAMHSALVAAVGYLACCRLMEQERLEEAEEQIAGLLEAETGLLDLHRGLMTCDWICCELLGENRRERVEMLLTEEQKKLMKALRKQPTVQRTEVMLALLHDRDSTRAEKILTQFEKAAKNAPYPAAVESEWVLINRAKAKAQEERA